MLVVSPPFVNASVVFPSVVQTKTGASTGRNTSFTATFDSPAIAGSILVIEMAIERNNAGPSAAPSGWTAGYINLDATSLIRSSLFYKVAAGGETSVTVTFGNNEWAWVFREFGGATNLTIGTGVVGNSNSPDPPSVSPGSGAPRLWVASAGFSVTSVNTYPSGYSSSLLAASSGGNNVRMTNAIKLSVSSSEDPAAYALAASARWTANTWFVE